MASFFRRLWKQISRFMSVENQKPQKIIYLPDLVEQARQDWIYAQKYYNDMVENELVDYAIYMMLAAERKYMYLLRRAHEEGVTYSPY